MSNADGKIRILTELDTKNFDAQINKLENDLEKMTKVLESDSKVDVSVRMSKEERLNLENDIEQIKNKIISLQEQKRKLENDNFGFSNLENGFKKILNSAKKLTLGILSIRTAYSLVSKASSAYMSTDDKYAKQMEANWIGIGTIFSGIIDLVMQGIKKLVTGILYFIDCLTGSNLVAKANEAILRKQKKATDNLVKSNNKLNASFDEMDVLQDNSSASENTNFGIDTSVLFDVNELGSNVKKTIEDIAEVLQPVYKIVKKIIKFGEEHPDILLGIIGGTLLLTTLGKVIGLAGSGTVAGTGLAGILGLLLGIVSIGVITISIKTIVDGVNDAKESFEVTEGLAENIKDISEQAGEEYTKFAEKVEKGNPTFDRTSNILLDITKNSLENAKAARDEIESWGPIEGVIKRAAGGFKAQTEAMLGNTTAAYNNMVALKKQYDQEKLNDEQTKNLKESLKQFVDFIGPAGKSVEDLAYEFELNREDAELLKEQYDNVKNMLFSMGEQTKPTGYFFKQFSEKMEGTKLKSDEAKTSFKNLDDMMLNLKKNNDVKLNVEANTKNAESTLSRFLDKFKSSFNMYFGVTAGAVAANLKFAKGGIVNNPSRGVPINAVAGEAGREGVIPLTDSQQMALLGEAIGKYININLTNITKLDNRQIAKEQKRINVQNDFAFNK